MTYMLFSNLTHFIAQYGSDYTVKWLRLACNVVDIENCED